MANYPNQGLANGLAGALQAATTRQQQANAINEANVAPKEEYPAFFGQLSDVSQTCYDLNSQINFLISRLFGEPTSEIIHPMNGPHVAGTMKILYSNLSGAIEQIARIRRALGD